MDEDGLGREVGPGFFLRVDPVFALNLVCASVDLCLNDFDLIQKRFMLADHEIAEGMAVHGTQVGYRFMVEIHKRVMQIGHHWGWPVQVRRGMGYDLEIIRQTVMAHVLTAITHLI